MPKFRKKPIIVDATQWLGWDKGPHHLGVEKVFARNIGSLKTLEGRVIVSPGDWIVIGVAGERYPVKPEIFAETFEPVSDLDQKMAEQIAATNALVPEAS